MTRDEFFAVNRLTLYIIQLNPMVRPYRVFAVSREEAERKVREFLA